ncbi:MAG: type IV secretory system conjugative DNA transfer family protein [Acidobacteria bacterium]|nr:type IV secretory system conjugative DNA transfer family protein [Acidobacteriota bacterium]
MRKMGNQLFADPYLTARLFLDRVTRSSLFAGAKRPIHKARLAHNHELASLMLGERPKPGTHLLIGRGPYNQILGVTPKPGRPELGNIAVIAPPRHGKGLHATAQLLTWEHSAIVIDIKGEHYERTGGAREKRFGPTFVLSPFGTGCQFDPLENCKTEDDCLTFANYMLEKTGDEKADAFILRAQTMLTAAFMAALKEGHPLLPYLAYLIHIGPEAAGERLEILSRNLALPEDKNLATRFLGRRFADTDFDDRYLQNSWANQTALLLPILTETVIRSVSGSDFTIEDFLFGKTVWENGRLVRKPITLYLSIPEERLKALSPLIRLVLKTIVNGITLLYDKRKGEGCQPVLLLADEAGAAPIPGLPELAATVCGRGISIWACFQDLNQPKSVYGTARAATLLNSMETQIFTRQSDLSSSEYVGRRLGYKSDYAHATSVHDTQTTESQSEQAILLFTPQEVSELSETEILCVHRNLKPFRARRTDWREYDDLIALVKIPAPALATLAEAPQIMPLTPNHQPEPLRVTVTDLRGIRRKHHSTYAHAQDQTQPQKNRQE